jgi:5-methylcytosine-specific restriction endonuclease McrA
MASDRNLTTTREQVFGDVEVGTECRICGRAVDDGRSKTCSEYCDNIQRAVMGMLNWNSVRRRILERDDKTCQQCGFDLSRDRLARDHIKVLIEEAAGERPKSPSARALGAGEMEDFDWDDHNARVSEWRDRKEAAEQRYGDPYEVATRLEVDHITPIVDGGHPFDPGNLQTLCEDCHGEKTAAENSERPQTPTRGELSESLFEYVTDGGDHDAG